nr:sigma-70 family RNA polymerase sigma factor [Allomuricauda sp.]
MEQEITAYYGPLLGFIKKRVHSQTDAEDLTQEVFLKLSKSSISEISNVKSWVYTIAKNSIIDHYRKKRVELQDLEDKLHAESETDEAIIHELSACILPFIEELPKEYRKLLKMSEIDGISQKAIAASLNMNYVTVRSKIQRGRQRLQALFLECCTVEKGGRGSIVGYIKKDNCC